eukprot:CAMPEP_0168790654 /NCGR_PEP_ID=MMETSP0725-20121227/13527_1 /TAXON_ID=265536 /ORGANISM="Amphiprora sp., Strain CCMP467" /LENGTH=460 /DNA_ID=CAMNT_0008841097 /DNA_START=39 /DNA_END=1421 /DNA_ORIENTATION=-
MKYLYDGKQTSVEGSFGHDMARALKITRRLVNFIRKSRLASAFFQQIQKLVNPNAKPKGLVKDVRTRGWATYSMVERFLELKDALVLMMADTNAPLGDCEKLGPTDWDNLELMMQVLQPFKNSQLRLEGVKYVTAPFVAWEVDTIRKELIEKKNNFRLWLEANEVVTGSQECPRTKRKYVCPVTVLLEDFDKRWRKRGDQMFKAKVERVGQQRQIGVHPAFYVAAYLDPRFKTLEFMRKEGGEQDSSIEALKSHVRSLLVKLSKEKIEETETEEEPEPAAQQAATAGVPGQSARERLGHLFRNTFNAPSGGTGEEDTDNNQIEIFCSQEMQNYQMAKQLDLFDKRGGDFSDTLGWWKERATHFPTLAKLAKMYLAIPATSAASERVFSLASRVMRELRGRLNPKLLSKLIFLCETWDTWEQEVGGIQMAAENMERSLNELAVAIATALQDDQYNDDGDEA